MQFLSFLVCLFVTFDTSEVWFTESTPFVTPVKAEEGFRFPRPAQPPAPPGVGSASKSIKSPLSAIANPNPLSPSSKEFSSSFKYPSVPRDEQSAHAPVGIITSRRDSLFAESHARLLSKLNQVNSDREEKTPASAQAQAVKGAEASPAVEKKKDTIAVAESQAEARRPSPVKFTSDRPEQFPLKPEPERPTKAAADGPKILSLENLDNFLVKDDMTDFEKEEVRH